MERVTTMEEAQRHKDFIDGATAELIEMTADEAAEAMREINRAIVSKYVSTYESAKKEMDRAEEALRLFVSVEGDTLRDVESFVVQWNSNQ